MHHSKKPIRPVHSALACRFFFREIQRAYYKAKKRQLSQKWLESELDNLMSTGLVVEDQSTKPYRYSLTEAAESITQAQHMSPGLQVNPPVKPVVVGTYLDGGLS